MLRNRKERTALESISLQILIGAGVREVLCLGWTGWRRLEGTRGEAVRRLRYERREVHEYLLRSLILATLCTGFP